MSSKLYNFLRKSFPDQMAEDGDPESTAIEMICKFYNVSIPKPETYNLESNKTLLTCSVSVLFNVGLGNQVGDMEPVTGASLSECQNKAQLAAENMWGEKRILEVKIRPMAHKA